MSNPRSPTWQWFLLAIPLIAVAVGTQFFMRKSYRDGGSGLTTASHSGGTRGKSKNDKNSNPYDRDDHYEPDSNVTPEEIARNERMQKKNREVHRENMADDSDVNISPAVNLGSAEVLAKGMSGGQCTPIEYRGDSGDKLTITTAEWSKVLDTFHEVKGSLLTWLEQRKRELPDKAFKQMQTQIREMTLQRPPYSDEPDLNWRGIGIFTQDATGKGMIRVGGGFVKLMHKQAKRGRFELLRLAAQSVSPCELQRIGAENVWEPLLKCLDMSEQQACAVGTYSEAGWAVSSTIAAHLAAPGCTLPAFKKTEDTKCLQKIPLPLTVAEKSHRLDLWANLGQILKSVY